MKAIPIEKSGKPEILKIREWKDPEIKDNEVLIEVKAFGINFADTMARKGLYEDAPPLPFIPGYEVAGIIRKTGKDAKNFSEGQRVLAIVDFGGYAELAAANVHVCFPLPDNLTFSQGASIPVNFITAFHCLYNTGILLPGMKVLIHAAAGGVGLSTVQLAKISGCEIFGTAGSESKINLLKEWGVDHPINYTTTDFETEIKKITNNDGIDIIIDSIGGNYLKKGMNILKANGRLVSMGVSSLSQRGGLNIIKLLPQVFSMLTLSAIDMLRKSKGFYGVNMNPLTKSKPELVSSNLGHIMEMFKDGKLKTVIGKEYSWELAAQAHDELENRKSTGKIVLTI